MWSAGHSVGEFVTTVACLEDALKLRWQNADAWCRYRALWLSWLVVLISSHNFLHPSVTLVALAAIGRTAECCHFWEQQAIETVCQYIIASNVKTKALQVSSAFPLFNGASQSFHLARRWLTSSKSRDYIQFDWTWRGEIATPEYCVVSIQRPVQFAASMKTLEQEGYWSISKSVRADIAVHGSMCVSESVVAEFAPRSNQIGNSCWESEWAAVCGVAVDRRYLMLSIHKKRVVVLLIYPSNAWSAIGLRHQKMDINIEPKACGIRE